MKKQTSQKLASKKPAKKPVKKPAKKSAKSQLKRRAKKTSRSSLVQASVARPSAIKASAVTMSTLDESLLNLPHSSLKKISKSIEKIQNFSNELVEKTGIAAMLGRAVLLRAKQIRESIKSQKPKTSKKAK